MADLYILAQTFEPNHMKKILTIIFSLLTLAAGAQQFRYGFFVSPVKNTWVLQWDEYTAFGPTSGFKYGFLFDQTIGKGEHLALTFGMNLDYTQGGMAQADNGQDHVDKDWMVRARYFEIPVLVKIRTGQIGKFIIYGQGGGMYGKALRSRGDYSENGVRHDTDINYLNNENSNLHYLPTNLSINLGIGTEIAITETASILLGFYFENGLTDIFQDSNVNTDILLQQMGIQIGGLF